MDQETVTLIARQWVRLPGTDREVYLCGKVGQFPIRRQRNGVWPLPENVFVRRLDQRPVAGR